MKIKNIASGDFVQIKNSLCHSEFKAKQVCEVIDVDHTDKHGFDVLIQGKNCLDWVNHKHLKKPEPQFKQLDQSVFDGAYKIWRFASVDADGAGFRFAERPELTDCFWRNVNCSRFDRLSQSGTYDTSDWQNSLIERDTAKELTGSDLARAMFERGDNYIMCVVGTIKEVVIIDTFQDGYFYSKGVRYLNPKPINNQGEPLTASEAGL